MGKRIAIAAIGTHGDIQPFVALAAELQRRGHQAVIGSTGDFEDFVTSRGIGFHNVGNDMQAFVRQRQFDDVMSRNNLIFGAQLLAQGQKIIEEAARHVWTMAQGTDAIVFHMNTTFAIDVAEALDIPAVMAAFQPLHKTGEFPYLAVDVAEPLDPVINRLTYVLRSAQQSYFDMPRNRLRDTLLGLGRRRHGGFAKDSNGDTLPTLHAYSSVVSPRPKDWPRSAVITGFWQLEDESDWQPSEEFQAFLNDGPPPVYIGFGSMAFGADRNAKVVGEALRLWGGRAVISRGWGGVELAEGLDTVFLIERAPHGRLFEYVDAVVHHGGAGTTAAGLYAGKPTFIIPQIFDQPYWGRRVHMLGCGPAPVRLRKLTAEILAQKLQDLTTIKAYRTAAMAVRSRLQVENGCERAAEVIEAVMTQHPTQPISQFTEVLPS